MLTITFDTVSGVISSEWDEGLTPEEVKDMCEYTWCKAVNKIETSDNSDTNLNKTRINNTEQYTYIFDDESESEQFKNLLDMHGVSYQLRNYTLLGDSFTDISVDAQIKPAVDTLYLERKKVWNQN